MLSLFEESNTSASSLMPLPLSTYDILIYSCHSQSNFTVTKKIVHLAVRKESGEMESERAKMKSRVEVIIGK